jgi:hypothetical protein
MTEYIIINKTAIQQRIEQLEKRSYLGLTDEEWNNERGQEKALKQILSQSTPLIPHIEKALYAKGAWFEDEVQDYISNLKLDI